LFGTIAEQIVVMVYDLTKYQTNKKATIVPQSLLIDPFITAAPTC
jgi:hypothetical protein